MYSITITIYTFEYACTQDIDRLFARKVMVFDHPSQLSGLRFAAGDVDAGLCLETAVNVVIKVDPMDYLPINTTTIPLHCCPYILQPLLSLHACAVIRHH